MDQNYDYDYELAMARLDAEPELDAHRETISITRRDRHCGGDAEAPSPITWPGEEIEANAQ
jgi:hypothetical protein